MSALGDELAQDDPEVTLELPRQGRHGDEEVLAQAAARDVRRRQGVLHRADEDIEGQGANVPPASIEGGLSGAGATGDALHRGPAKSGLRDLREGSRHDRLLEGGSATTSG